MNREGRLEGFNARREELRAALREQGMRRKEAADEAWRQALAEFPPLESESHECDEAQHDVDNEGLEEEIEKFRKDGSAVMLEDDVEWVYLHLSARNLSPSDAPSPGAWSLHSVAKKDKRWFLKDIVPKIRHKKEDDDQKNMRVAEEKSIKQRQEILQGILHRSNMKTLEAIRDRLTG